MIHQLIADIGAGSLFRVLYIVTEIMSFSADYCACGGFLAFDHDLELAVNLGYMGL